MKQEQKRDAHGRFVKTSPSKEELLKQVETLQGQVDELQHLKLDLEGKLYKERDRVHTMMCAYKKQYDRASVMFDIATWITRRRFINRLPQGDDTFFFFDGKVIPII